MLGTENDLYTVRNLDYRREISLAEVRHRRPISPARLDIRKSRPWFRTNFTSLLPVIDDFDTLS